MCWRLGVCEIAIRRAGSARLGRRKRRPGRRAMGAREPLYCVRTQEAGYSSSCLQLSLCQLFTNGYVFAERLPNGAKNPRDAVPSLMDEGLCASHAVRHLGSEWLASGRRIHSKFPDSSLVALIDQTSNMELPWLLATTGVPPRGDRRSAGS